MKLLHMVSSLCLTAIIASAAPTQPDKPLPTHFGLFMYSLDGTIINETLYARSVPCVPDTTARMSTVQEDSKYGTYGSYTWGIGPNGHIFSYKDGRIATCYPSCTTSRNVFGGTSQVLVQTWQTYYNQADITPIPICGISQNICLGTCNLECSSEGQILIWSFCGTKVLESGQRYTLDVLSWSTVVAPDCIEVEIRIIDEPKDWGNQTYSQTGIYKDCDDVLGD